MTRHAAGPRARHGGRARRRSRAPASRTSTRRSPRAKAAFPAWRAVAPGDRARLLLRVAALVEERLEELATLEARNAGKPIGDARGEIGMVAETFRYYAGAPSATSATRSRSPAASAMTFREPLGVVGLITPWNFPLAIAAWKLAPALAAGNTVVLKPAELTPLTALRFERLALEAGLPEGVVNVVVGPGRTCGTRLVEHPDVAKIAFTGSTEVGALDRRRRRADDQARDARARRQVGQRRLRRRRPRARPPRPRPARCSPTPARTAARARGSSSSARRSIASWTRSRRPSTRCASATRSTRPPRWAR